jgi:hypothetical protein
MIDTFADARIAVEMLIAEQPQNIPDHPRAGSYHCGDPLCHLARPCPGPGDVATPELTRNPKEVKADKKNQRVKHRIAVVLRCSRG